MKAAFDWKARKLGRTDFTDCVNDLVILHFRQAFHGRSGYTMSVTNTLPDKVGLFPKFDWPRVHNPYLHFDLDGSICNDYEAEEAKAKAEIEAAFEHAAANGTHIAGILIEPMQGEGGDNHFRTEFLQALRDYADEREALLIFDEVMTGFRVALGGVQQREGVTPDLTAMGKIIGGGLPVGAFGGRAEVMDHLAPDGPVYQAGTLSGNPLAMAAGIAALRTLEEEDPYPRLAELGEKLADGIREAASSTGIAMQVPQVGSMLCLFFSEDPVMNFEQAVETNTDHFKTLFSHALGEGVYLPPSAFETCFLSIAHGDAEIDRTIEVITDGIRKL